MRLRITAILSGCAFLCAAGPVFAAETYVNLAMAVAQARDNNKELAAMRQKLGVLRAAVRESAAYPNPSVELEKETPADSPYHEFKIQQPFAIGGRVRFSKRVAEGELEAFIAEIAALENEVAALAKKTYYVFRLAGERIRFEESNLRFSLDILNNLQFKLQTGQAGNSDVARARVDVAQSKYRLEEAQARLKIAEAELNYAMGRDPQEALSAAQGDPLPGVSFEGGERSLQSMLALALSSRADLKALASRGKAAETALSLEKRKRVPDLTLGWIIGQDPEESYSKLAVGLELPLWNANGGSIARAAVGKAVLAREAARLELAVRRELYSAWLGCELAAKRVRAAKEIALSLAELRKNASLDYLSGKSGLTAFYETNRIFLEENLNYLDGLQEYYDKAADLEKAAGVAATGEMK